LAGQLKPAGLVSASPQITSSSTTRQAIIAQFQAPFFISVDTNSINAQTFTIKEREDIFRLMLYRVTIAICFVVDDDVLEIFRLFASIH